MELLVPIVGLRHYIAEPTTFLTTIQDGDEIILVPDAGNLRDRTAIAAYQHRRQIGYVSSDFTEWIHANYPDFQSLVVPIQHNDYAIDDNAFYVAVEVQVLEIPASEPRILPEPVHGIPLPMPRIEHRLAIADVQQRCHELEAYFDGVSVDESVVESLIDTARRLAGVYGHSLSGDDRRVCFHLLGLMQTAMSYCTANMCELFEEKMTIEDIRYTFARDAKAAAAIMQQEIAEVRAGATAFLSEYKGLMESGLATADELHTENDTWLRALPSNLYIHLDNHEELAARLFYERLSTTELYTVYLHLILRDELPAKKAAPQPEKTVGKAARVRFAYWATNPAPTAIEKREAKADLLDAAKAKKQSAERLGKVIAHLQKNHVLQEDLKPTNRFCENLAAWLNIPNPYHSLKRYL